MRGLLRRSRTGGEEIGWHGVSRTGDDHAWVNPCKEEAWEYLAEIALEAQKLGFDEIQFDYVRFCTEKGMRDAVFSEEDTKGPQPDRGDPRLYGI